LILAVLTAIQREPEAGSSDALRRAVGEPNPAGDDAQPTRLAA
jgi:hypothetical protein